MLSRLRELALQQRGLAGQFKFALESILVVAGTAGLALAIWHHFVPDEPAPFPGEGKRVVAFRQATSRVCTENRDNMTRALTEARSRVGRLSYVARALDRDLNDLEGITAPPVKFDSFLEEIAVRHGLRDEFLALQQAIELGRREDQGAAIEKIEELSAESREISRETGIVRCIYAAPSTRELLESAQQ